MSGERGFFAKLLWQKVTLRKRFTHQATAETPRRSFGLAIPEASGGQRGRDRQEGQDGTRQQGQFWQALDAFIRPHELAVRPNHLFGRQGDLFGRPAVLVDGFDRGSLQLERRGQDPGGRR